MAVRSVCGHLGALVPFYPRPVQGCEGGGWGAVAPGSHWCLPLESGCTLAQMMQENTTTEPIFREESTLLIIDRAMVPNQRVADIWRHEKHYRAPIWAVTVESS